jgi:hypothetical protein
MTDLRATFGGWGKVKKDRVRLGRLSRFWFYYLPLPADVAPGPRIPWILQSEYAMSAAIGLERQRLRFRAFRLQIIQGGRSAGRRTALGLAPSDWYDFTAADQRAAEQGNPNDVLAKENAILDRKMKNICRGCWSHYLCALKR